MHTRRIVVVERALPVTSIANVPHAWRRWHGHGRWKRGAADSTPNSTRALRRRNTIADGGRILFLHPRSRPPIFLNP